MRSNAAELLSLELWWIFHEGRAARSEVTFCPLAWGTFDRAGCQKLSLSQYRMFTLLLSSAFLENGKYMGKMEKVSLFLYARREITLMIEICNNL